jgi:hypothetical protein
MMPGEGSGDHLTSFRPVTAASARIYAKEACKPYFRINRPTPSKPNSVIAALVTSMNTYGGTKPASGVNDSPATMETSPIAVHQPVEIVQKFGWISAGLHFGEAKNFA